MLANKRAADALGAREMENAIQEADAAASAMVRFSFITLLATGFLPPVYPLLSRYTYWLTLGCRTC